jgi:hypothetical protein
MLLSQHADLHKQIAIGNVCLKAASETGDASTVIEHLEYGRSGREATIIDQDEKIALLCKALNKFEPGYCAPATTDGSE